MKPTRRGLVAHRNRIGVGVRVVVLVGVVVRDRPNASRSTVSAETNAASGSSGEVVGASLWATKKSSTQRNEIVQQAGRARLLDDYRL